MDWDRAETARSQPDSPEGRVFYGLRRILARRAAVPEFHAGHPIKILHTGNSNLFALARYAPFGSVVCIYNFSETWTAVPASWAHQHGMREGYEALSDAPVAFSGGAIPLPPYARAWLRQARPGARRRQEPHGKSCHLDTLPAACPAGDRVLSILSRTNSRAVLGPAWFNAPVRARGRHGFRMPVGGDYADISGNGFADPILCYDLYGEPRSDTDLCNSAPFGKQVGRSNWTCSKTPTASAIPGRDIQPLPGKAPWLSRKMLHDRAKNRHFFEKNPDQMRVLW